MTLSCDKRDIYLFVGCTKIAVGNEQKAMFWTDRWLHGMAPAEMAPLLTGLAQGKLLSVAEVLNNRRWMRGLSRICNEKELQQFL
jgi:hypothetical protein